MNNGSTTQDLRGILAEARNASAAREAERGRAMREHEQKHRKTKQARDELIQSSLRPAHVGDYERWLKGYLEQGGEIGQVYKYPMPDRFYITTRDIFDFPKLCGALSISVIVPEGMEFPDNEGHMPYGHCDIYFMDGFRTCCGEVPLYSNIDF